MAVGNDAPSWSFGLNPKRSIPLVPGPGTYSISGRLVADGVGTHFAPINAQTDVVSRRLVFRGGVVPIESSTRRAHLYLLATRTRTSFGGIICHPISIVYLMVHLIGGSGLIVQILDYRAHIMKHSLDYIHMPTAAAAAVSHHCTVLWTTLCGTNFSMHTRSIAVATIAESTHSPVGLSSSYGENARIGCEHRTS